MPPFPHRPPSLSPAYLLSSDSSTAASLNVNNEALLSSYATAPAQVLKTMLSDEEGQLSVPARLLCGATAAVVSTH